MDSRSIVGLGGCLLAAIGILLMVFRRRLTAFALDNDIPLRGLPGRPSERFFFYMGLGMLLFGIALATPSYFH